MCSMHSVDYLHHNAFIVALQVAGNIASCNKTLKGHSQLVHMRIRYHFLADLHITLHHKSRAEKRIL